MRGDEENVERIPLGIPIGPADCALHGALCEPDDHTKPPTVNGEVL